MVSKSPTKRASVATDAQIVAFTRQVNATISMSVEVYRRFVGCLRSLALEPRFFQG